MITTLGKQHIRNVLAKQAPVIGSQLAFGVGSVAASLSDDRLNNEVTRIQLTGIAADQANSRLVFKCTLSPGSINLIYEIGLLSTNAIATDKKLGIFAASASWSNATRVATNARAGTETIKIDWVTSGTTNATLTGFREDLSSFLGADYIVIAFTATTNLSSLRVRLGSDSSNYYEFVVSSPVVGYNVVRLAKSTVTTTGVPDWTNLSYLAVRPSGTAGGAGSIYVDGIRFEQAVSSNDAILVARYVPASPIVVDPDISTDVEFSLDVIV